MRDRPAKVDLDIRDLTVAYGKNLGISKSLSVGVLSFVGYEYTVAIWNEIDIVEVLDPFAVRPATRKISCAIDTIVQRAGKAKILGNQSFDCRAIFGDIRVVG